MQFLWISFSVTADYKALLLCTQKRNGQEVKLGGQGKGVEACLFCTAIRVSEYHINFQNIYLFFLLVFT